MYGRDAVDKLFDPQLPPGANTQELTRTLHPPAGATALIAVIGGDAIQRLGWWSVAPPLS